ncbi:MAG: HEAT repeat domain-containing protein [Candidatus Heimdallarchaeota archaeon]
MAAWKEIVSELKEAKTIEEKCLLIKRLGERKETNAMDSLISLLKNEENNTIKSFATDAIIKIGGKKATIKAIKLLRNPSWVTRMKAAEILGELGNRLAVLPLIRVLRSDTEPNVKEWAAIALGKIKDKRACKALVNSLRTEESWQIRMEAAMALGAIQNKQVLEDLVNAYYNDPDIRVRWAAATAQAKIDKQNSSRLVKELRNELLNVLKEEKDETILCAAAKALGEIGDVSVLNQMINTMKISKEMVRLELNVAVNKIAKKHNVKNQEELLKNNNLIKKP